MKPVIKDLSWWRKRTTLERCLTVISILACTLVIGVVSVWVSLLLRNEMSKELRSTVGLINASVVQPSYLPLVFWLTGNPGDRDLKPDVCSSAECLHTASEVLDKMNPAIDPCDDFYEFACGKFNEKTQLSPDKAAESISLLLATKLKKQMENIIVEERPKTDPKYLRYPNDFYKACMNTTLIESLGTQPMQNISGSLGGWPVVVGNSWDCANSWSWQDTIKKLKPLGFDANSLFRIYVGPDWKNSTKHIIRVDQPLLSVEAEYIIKLPNSSVSTLLYDYMLDYMVDVAVMFGADRTTAERELRETLQFQMDLSFILEPSQRQAGNNLYNLRSIKELQKSYPYIQWLDLINSMLPNGQGVDENEVVNLMAPNFFAQLGILLESTNKRVIANYLMWNVHDSSLIFLTKLLQERQFHYDSLLLGKYLQVGRWKECISMVTSNLEILVGSLFVRKHFKKDSKDLILETVNNIRDALDQRLDRIKWMDENAKQQAKKKLHDMKAFIGYPDEMLDNDKLENYYRELEIDPEKYFESYLNIEVFKNNKMFKKLRMSANKGNSFEHFKPTDVNAFYSLDQNIMQFPAGILQDPFFNPNLPNYMNYGAIGSIIGHEISHGFSGDGRRYDTDGQLKNWWHPNTEKKYIKKARCIQEKYGNYTDKQSGLKVIDYRSRKENIADIGGIQLSYNAYEKWVVKNGEEKKLLGLNYTPRQMFWISFAQMWCAKYETETRKKMITDSSYLPRDLRGLGSLRSIKEFSRDFQCPNNTLMNPVKKCVIW